MRLQLEAARAQVSAAEANLQTVRAEYRRYRTLLDRNLVSHSQFENIQNSYRAGEARLKQIRAEFNVADNQAGYAVLRSPQDGVIASRRVEVGQVVAAGQTVFSLAADGEREVLIGLPERSFERFRIGQPVSVELWSQRDRRFAGHIRELARGRSAIAYLRRPGGLRRPRDSGRTGPERAGLRRRRRGGAVIGSLSALTAEAGQAFVWVVEPGSSTLRRQAVRTGPYAEDRVPVLEGLKAGDWVVATGVRCFAKGSRCVRSTGPTAR